MRIRRYRSQDYPKVLNLIRTVYNKDVEKTAQARFKWQYENNPANTIQDPNLLVLEHQDSIVGMVGSFSQRLKLEDTVAHAYWMGDFMVHPDFRKQQYGLAIAKRLKEDPYLMMGFPSQDVLKLWSRAGAIKFGEISEYTRTNPKSETLIQLFSSKLFKSAFKIIQVSDFDSRFDQLWNKVSKEIKVIQVRDKLYLEWRFLKCPHLSYTILSAVNPQNELVGYSILRTEKKSGGTCIGYIVDLLAHDEPKLYQTIIRESIKVLTDKKCSHIVTRISSYSQTLKKILHSLGFKVTERKTGIFYNNSFKGYDVMLSQPKNWHLTMADSDMDFA